MASSSTKKARSSGGGCEEESSAGVTPLEKEEGRWNWLDLPRELTALIFSRLFAFDILYRAQFVCKAWLEISNDPLVWKRIEMHKPGDECDFYEEFDLEKMFLCAVDRSCGQAVDINLDSFGTDETLGYITDRLTRIKHLRLTHCNSISDQGLIENVAKLPSLKDLELSVCPFAAETIEVVGRNCPRLKLFKSNCRAHTPMTIHFIREIDTNRGAFAIAKSMPELSSLQLMGNYMNEKGLEAILNGCPKLEYLDLRRCRNINLNGSVWKRCTEQVKHLRHPDESTKDCPSHPESNFSYSSNDDDDDDDDDDHEDDDDDDDDGFGPYLVGDFNFW